MAVELVNNIVAIVTEDKEKVASGFAPTFYAQNQKESEKIALILAKITMGMVHDLENGVHVVVKH